jgi:hypothetical protein
VYSILTKVTERLTRNIKKTKQYRVEISNRFTGSQNLVAQMDINRAWETIRENIKISAMIRRRMLKIIASNETRQIAVVTGSERNKWA